jgi:hypothetical protein
MIIEVIGGGTFYHVRNHLSLCAPAFGTTARKLYNLCGQLAPTTFNHINMHLTNMAGGKEGLDTNEDVSKLVDKLVLDQRTKIIFFNPALVDYTGTITESGAMGHEWVNDLPTPSGKHEERLQTSKGSQMMKLEPAPKILKKIRKERKDIFLVAFKTTCGATLDEQFVAGLKLLKDNSCNLVFANDTKTRQNMVITPEQSRYFTGKDRDVALRGMVEMALARCRGTFTHSRVVTGRGIPWKSDTVPATLRTVVDHCIAKGAYKPFNGATVGHFAAKIDSKKFMTSLRGSNFNNLEELAYVHAADDHNVVSQGGKPSVGGQSQRIIFKEHPEMDCIVHFHCPPKSDVELSVKSQFFHECGSHECGENTSRGLREEVSGIKCVYLDNHGPNIVFNRNIDPQKVIQFIDNNFELSQSTDQLKRGITLRTL